MSATLAEIVARNLKRLLKERDLTQEALADRTGLTRATINHYAAGDKKGIKPAILEKIAAGLGVDISQLLKVPESPRKEGEIAPEEISELMNGVPEDILRMLAKCKHRDEALRAVRALLLGLTAR